jgi:hypothetical protein
MTLPRAPRQFIELFPIAFVPGRHSLSSTVLRRNCCPIGCKANPSGSLYFRRRATAPRHEGLTIYASSRAARHFLFSCIKPVTGLLVSRLYCCSAHRGFVPGNGAEGPTCQRIAVVHYQVPCRSGRRPLYTTRIRRLWPLES